MSKLGELKPGQSGRIKALSSNVQMEPIVRRLMEMGMIEGERIEVLHQAPWGGDPIAVRVRGNLIGVRRDEANLVDVEL